MITPADPEWNSWATLSNDVSDALRLLPTLVLFSQKRAVAQHLWALGYRPPFVKHGQGSQSDNETLHNAEWQRGEDDWRRPCKGQNSNVCVAEGCWDDACLKLLEARNEPVRCGAPCPPDRQYGYPWTCVRSPGHDGDHGEGGVFWPQGDGAA